MNSISKLGVVVLGGQGQVDPWGLLTSLLILLIKLQASGRPCIQKLGV